MEGPPCSPDYIFHTLPFTKPRSESTAYDPNPISTPYPFKTRAKGKGYGVEMGLGRTVVRILANDGIKSLCLPVWKVTHYPCPCYISGGGTASGFLLLLQAAGADGFVRMSRFWPWTTRGNLPHPVQSPEKIVSYEALGSSNTKHKCFYYFVVAVHYKSISPIRKSSCFRMP